MMYAFLAHLYGEDDPVLVRTMNVIEYAPHTDPSWDPFSIVHNVGLHILVAREIDGSKAKQIIGARTYERQLGELC
jgi:hypothetical protein